MKPKQFFTGLAMMALVQAILNLILVWSVQAISVHLGFIIVAMLTMIGFCIMMYVAARISADSKLTRLYIQLIMIAVFLKMLVCLALIIGYKKGFDPADNTFVWPFLIIYVTSTIYEVIFLDKVGRQKKTILP
jgi:peptidoglycan/LPS O-acetylase OafA/YrhL